MQELKNNKCQKCGGIVTGDQFEFISHHQVTQDVTCDACGTVYRHYYTLTDIIDVKELE